MTRGTRVHRRCPEPVSLGERVLDRSVELRLFGVTEFALSVDAGEQRVCDLDALTLAEHQQHGQSEPRRPYGLGAEADRSILISLGLGSSSGSGSSPAPSWAGDTTEQHHRLVGAS